MVLILLYPGEAGDPVANHHGQRRHPNMRVLLEDVLREGEEEEQAPVLIPSPKSYLLLTVANHLMVVVVEVR